ncbi:itaconate degradation C-C-lyase RipC [Ktedonobacter racemifer]|uniref:Citrate (Pro-3S)-lyase n=1 Tax=Ktedonobacter racemifer DSM 44963 TaxID=485913 RepID=D6U5E0_KTERA|nr:itaconate degradation C-C-lyase RipC [Ktedonobacter racemifer]EFH81720.1 Citrate (pro-3S)-lyase [Ktedonobacter racemifer DSM 44963]
MTGRPKQKPLLSLKSWLFTPGTKSDRFARAAEAHADALVIDLEDAVAPSAKSEARAAAIAYLNTLPEDRLPCALRINSPQTKVGLDDLQALLDARAEPDYLVIPKCDSAGIISLVGNLLTEAEKSTEIIALIETVEAVAALEEIASHHPRPAAFLFGAADMAADLGAEAAWEPLLFTRSRLIQVGAMAGIVTLDSPYFNLSDEPGLRQETKAAANLGFHGKCAIHPGQIPTINEVLTPTEQEVEWARRVLEVNRQGVGSVDHQMVDEAIARRARRILARVRGRSS